MTAIIDQLITEAARHPDLLVAYKDDLHKHDRAALKHAKAGETWIWLLRDYGTQIMPVAAGCDPVLITYWLKPGVSGSPPKRNGQAIQCAPRAYRIEITRDRGEAGTIHHISHEQAKRLAARPAPKSAKPRAGWSEPRAAI